MRPTSPYLWLGLFGLAALIGVGAFTFHYGEGLSYEKNARILPQNGLACHSYKETGAKVLKATTSGI